MHSFVTLSASFFLEYSSYPSDFLVLVYYSISTHNMMQAKIH